MAVLFILLFFSLVLALVIVTSHSFLGTLLGHSLRERLTARWPVVPGTVEAFDTRPERGKTTTLSLYYSYEVNERFYSGTFDKLCDSFNSAYFVWLRWKGLRIPIRHKPAAPSISFFPERAWRREQPAGFDRPRTN
jgi:hypothetical protein